MCRYLNVNLLSVHCITTSGGFRNLERGVQPLACEVHPKNFKVAMPTSGHVKVRTKYLEAILGLVKRLEISWYMSVVPGCCCCIIIWWTRAVMYAKINLLATKGGGGELASPKSATDNCACVYPLYYMCRILFKIDEQLYIIKYRIVPSKCPPPNFDSFVVLHVTAHHAKFSHSESEST